MGSHFSASVSPVLHPDTPPQMALLEPHCAGSKGGLNATFSIFFPAEIALGHIAIYFFSSHKLHLKKKWKRTFCAHSRGWGGEVITYSVWCILHACVRQYSRLEDEPHTVKTNYTQELFKDSLMFIWWTAAYSLARCTSTCYIWLYYKLFINILYQSYYIIFINILYQSQRR